MKQALLSFLFILLTSFVVFGETEPNNTCMEANEIIFGSSMTGNFSAGNDWDYYTVFIPTAGAVVFTVDNADINTTIGFSIMQNCNGGLGLQDGKPGEKFKATVFFSTSGIYIIRLYNLSNKTSLSDYTFSVETDNSDIYEFNNLISLASPIALNTDIYAALNGVDINGSFNNYHDLDYYKVIIPEKGIMKISVNGVADTTKMYIDVFDAEGENFTNDHCVLLGESIECFQSIVCDTGVYFIKLGNSTFPNYSNAGTYTLRVELIPDSTECNNDQSSAIPLVLDKPVSANIRNGDIDFYKFEVTEPMVMDYKISELENPDMSKYLSLYTSDGLLKWEGSYNKNGGISQYTDYSICEPGTYYLEVREKSSIDCISKKTYFPYNLTISGDNSDTYECNNTLANATSIAIGEKITTFHNSYNDVDFFKFSANAQDSVIIDFSLPLTKRMVVKLMNTKTSQVLKEATLKNSADGLYTLNYYPIFETGEYLLITELEIPNKFNKEPHSFVINTNQKTTATSDLVFQNLQVYPNPVNDYLKLIGNQTLLNSASIEIINVLGKIVGQVTIKDQNESLDVSDLGPGSYFITLISEGNRITKSFIKN